MNEAVSGGWRRSRGARHSWHLLRAMAMCGVCVPSGMSIVCVCVWRQHVLCVCSRVRACACVRTHASDAAIARACACACACAPPQCQSVSQRRSASQRRVGRYPIRRVDSELREQRTCSRFKTAFRRRRSRQMRILSSQAFLGAFLLLRVGRESSNATSKSVPRRGGQQALRAPPQTS